MQTSLQLPVTSATFDLVLYGKVLPPMILLMSNIMSITGYINSHDEGPFK